MITDTSWIVARHPYAFLPKPWQVVLCKRDLSTEVLPGVTERRSAFTIDIHSGKSWLRQGTGSYEYWSHFPSFDEWCAAEIIPPSQTFCVLGLEGGHHKGVHIGQVVIDSMGHANWQMQEPYSTQWTTVLSKNVSGWLLLPPVEEPVRQAKSNISPR